MWKIINNKVGYRSVVSLNEIKKCSLRVAVLFIYYHYNKAPNRWKPNYKVPYIKYLKHKKEKWK